MSKRIGWKSLLNTANEDVAKWKYSIKITDEEEKGFYKCLILKGEEVVETYAENYYESELTDLINEVWHYIATSKHLHRQ